MVMRVSGKALRSQPLDSFMASGPYTSPVTLLETLRTPRKPPSVLGPPRSGPKSTLDVAGQALSRGGALEISPTEVSSTEIPSAPIAAAPVAAETSGVEG